MTDHSAHIQKLRDEATRGFATLDEAIHMAEARGASREEIEQLETLIPPLAGRALAADLLQMHDSRAISLDNWGVARLFVEMLTKASVEPNGVTKFQHPHNPQRGKS